MKKIFLNYNIIFIIIYLILIKHLILRGNFAYIKLLLLININLREKIKILK